MSRSAWTEAPGSTVRVVAATVVSLAAASPSWVPELPPTKETPGYPLIVQLVVPLFVRTNVGYWCPAPPPDPGPRLASSWSVLHTEEAPVVPPPLPADVLGSPSPGVSVDEGDGAPPVEVDDEATGEADSS